MSTKTSDNKMSKKPELPYPKIDLCVLGIDEIDLDNVVQTAYNEHVSEKYPSTLNSYEPDTNENNTTKEGWSNRVWYINNFSSQGLDVIYRQDGKDSSIMLSMPCFASPADILLAYGIAKVLSKEYPESGVYLGTDYERGQFALVEDNYYNLIRMCMANVEFLIEINRPGESISIRGLNHDYFLPNREDHPGKETLELAIKALEEFVHIQWDYQEYTNAGNAMVTSPEGEKYSMRFLTNIADTFVGISQKLALSKSHNDNTIKIVDRDEFVNKMKENKHFRMIDSKQFTLDKMPDSDWDKLYDLLQGDEISSKKKPIENHNVYILRWNPTFSSYKPQYYNNDHEKHADGWVMDWSIYEYQQAGKGDLYVMMKVGVDNPGIVFHGEFLTNPYVDSDWAGTSKKRHYILMSCLDSTAPDANPLLSAEELEQSIPDINWRKGHSGELMSPENAQKLLTLLQQKIADKTPTKTTDKSKEFDAEGNMGAKNKCFDEDLETIFDNINNILHQSYAQLGPFDTYIKDDRHFQLAQLLLAKSGNPEFSLQITNQVIGADGNKQLKFMSLVPVVSNDTTIPLKIIKVREYDNVFEAVITATLPNDREISFFDTRYAVHKDRYMINETYNFSLSAVAFKAKVIPEEDLEFTIDSETVERMHANAPEVVKRDENGVALPMNIRMDQLVACLQHDDAYPEDAEFQSPIAGRIKKIVSLGREFYRIPIYIDQNPGDEPVKIPLIVKKEFFTEKPKSKTPIRGYLWLQGHLQENRQ